MYDELKVVHNKPELIISLGGDYAKNRYHWDDAYSIKKIFEDLEFVNDLEFLNIEREIIEMIGKNEIISVKNNFFSKKVTLIKNFLRPMKSKYKFFYYIYTLIAKLFYLITSKKNSL